MNVSKVKDGSAGAGAGVSVRVEAEDEGSGEDGEGRGGGASIDIRQWRPNEVITMMSPYFANWVFSKAKISPTSFAVHSGEKKSAGTHSQMSTLKLTDAARLLLQARKVANLPRVLRVVDGLCFVSKPSGLLTHPLPRRRSATPRRGRRRGRGAWTAPPDPENDPAPGAAGAKDDQAGADGAADIAADGAAEDDDNDDDEEPTLWHWARSRSLFGSDSASGDSVRGVLAAASAAGDAGAAAAAGAVGSTGTTGTPGTADVVAGTTVGTMTGAATAPAAAFDASGLLTTAASAAASSDTSTDAYDASARTVHFVNRLDRGTSGIVAIAQTGELAAAVQGVWPTATKQYLTLVRGKTDDSFIVDQPLTDRGVKRSGKSKTKGAFPKRAVTGFTLVRTYFDGNVSLLQATLVEGGRLHQIRRHLAKVAHQVLGDRGYGKGRINKWLADDFGLGRIFLHCEKLALTHPSTGESIVVEDPLPDELVRFLERIAADDGEGGEGGEGGKGGEGGEGGEDAQGGGDSTGGEDSKEGGGGGAGGGTPCSN